ncbi:MAG: LysM peptidoglycan-binding domain-containing protein [Flavobacteriaceae bacterium]|nr:LysM peptidoglycan-binding domain-containing protein [Flavobacteriaceae bacterium]
MGIKLKQLVLVFAFVLLAFPAIKAQEYRTHKVKAGETIESIASAYMVTPFDIFALNPDAKSDLRPEMVIIIPKSRVAEKPTTVEKQEVSGFKKHKVKRKETLFSIAKRYGIAVDDIKKYNKRLYSQNLRKGDRIEIPLFKTVRVTNRFENTIQAYEVLPKEGKWRIAYKYGITVDELENLNPNLADTLQVGQRINVPNIADNEVRTLDDTYGYYTVLPKEGFYRLKIKLGLTQEQLEELNPELKDSGLKVGMVLKVPKDISVNSGLEDVDQTLLINKIADFEKKRLALMLPFRLHRIDLDSIQEARDILLRDSYMNISIDFYTGVMVALDSAKKLGLSTRLDVFDTRARINQVTRLVDDNDFSEYDAVIGPFTADNFDRVASRLRNSSTPVFAAVSKPKKLYSNVYQTVPSEEFLRKRMIEFLKSDESEKKVIIISDSKHKAVSDQLNSELPGAVQIFSRKNKEGRDSQYILVDDLERHLEKGKTLVLLETDNEGFISNVTSMLSAFNGVDPESQEEREIILMTTDRNKAFQGANISNYDLSSLHFHFPSAYKTVEGDSKDAFIKKYKSEYRAEPNRYAIRGFDLTMDILLRLATEDSLEGISSNDIETEYVGNKFRYSKKMFGGYYNESGYIVKYDDLRIVEVQE